MKVKLNEIISDTYTNNAGHKLFAYLDNKIQNAETLQLSFEQSSPLASSFYNSSIGALIEKYTLEKVRQYVKFVDLTKPQYELLMLYIKGKTSCN